MGTQLLDHLSTSALEAFSLLPSAQLSAITLPGTREALFLKGLRALHATGTLPDGLLVQLAALEREVSGHSPAACELEVRELLAAFDVGAGSSAQTTALDKLFAKLKELHLWPGMHDYQPAAPGAVVSGVMPTRPSALDPSSYTNAAYWANVSYKADPDYILRQADPAAVMRLWHMDRSTAVLAPAVQLDLRTHILDAHGLTLPVAALEGVMQASTCKTTASGSARTMPAKSHELRRQLSLAQLQSLAAGAGWPATYKWEVIQRMLGDLRGQQRSSNALRSAEDTQQEISTLLACEKFLEALPSPSKMMVALLRVKRAACLLTQPGTAAALEELLPKILEGSPLRIDLDVATSTSALEKAIPRGLFAGVAVPGANWELALLDQLIRLLLQPSVDPEAFLGRRVKAAAHIDEPLREYILALTMLLRGAPERVWAAKYTAAYEALSELRPRVCGVPLFSEWGRDGVFWRWSSQMALQDVAERVCLAFSPLNHTKQAVDVDLVLHMEVKNVAQLTVKVYDINLVKYYKVAKQAVHSGIALDGLGASQTFGVVVPGPAFVLRQVNVCVPNMRGRRGCFVIDVSGGGLTCRAVVRKGALTHVTRHSAAGHALSVFYEDGSRPAAPCAFLDGRKYEPQGSQGEIIVPYGVEAASKRLVLSDELDLAEMVTFRVEREHYEFVASLHVERETLVPRNKAPVLVRAKLMLHGFDAPLKLLQDVELRLEATDAAGTVTTHAVKGFQLAELPDVATHELPVPQNCRALTITLQARVRLSARGANDQVLYQDVEASMSTTLNGSEDSLDVADAHLTVLPDGQYAVRVTGRCGEPMPAQELSVRLTHWAWRDSLVFACGTDAAGTCALGPLTDIRTVEVHLATESNSIRRSWSLEALRAVAPLPSQLHVDAGSEIVLPYTLPFATEDVLMEGVAIVRRTWLRPPEKRGVQEALGIEQNLPHDGAYATWEALPRSHVTIRQRCVHVSGLPEGCYELYLPGAQHSVKIQALPPTTPLLVLGRSRYRFALERVWQMSRLEAVSISSLEASQIDGVKVGVQLGDLEPALLSDARVTLLLTRFMPLEDDAPAWRLWDAPGSGKRVTVTSNAAPPSSFLAGAVMGGETRYVLDRRAAVAAAPPRPGTTLLDKPSLLIDPTETKASATQDLAPLAPGGAFGKLCAQAEYAAQDECYKRRGGRGGAGHSSLSQSLAAFPAACVIANLKCGADGTVAIPASALPAAAAGYTMVRAVVSTKHGAVASAAAAISGGAPPATLQVLDPRRGRAPLEECALYKRVQRVLACQPGESLAVADITNAALNIVDSLDRAYSLFASLLEERSTVGALHESGQPHAALWRTFDFLPRWPSLDETRKLQLVSEHASHELSFFVKCVDPGFFDARMRPLLAMRLPSERDCMTLVLLDDGPALAELAATPERVAGLQGIERLLLAAALQRGPALASAALECLGKRAQEEDAPHDGARELSLRKKFAVALQSGSLGGGDGDRFLDSEKVAQAIQDAHEYSMFSAQMPMMACMAAPAPPMAYGAPGGPAKSLAAPRKKMAARSLMMEKEASSGSRDREESCDDECAEEFEAEGGGGEFDSDLTARAMQEEGRPVGGLLQTKEWVEARYYKILESGNARLESLVELSAFWADYAHWQAAPAARRAPFLSTNVHLAATTFTGAVLALGILGATFLGPAAASRPADSREHTFDYRGLRLDIRVAKPAVVFLQETRPLNEEEKRVTKGAASGISGMQRLFDPRMRYRRDPETGEDMEVQVGSPLLRGKVYGTHVVITNASCNDHHSEIVLLVPSDAIPLCGRPFVDVQQRTIPRYSCTQLEQHFYFPDVGRFAMPPVTLVKRDALLSWLPPALGEVEVVGRAAEAARETLALTGAAWLLSSGASDEEVLAAMRSGQYRLPVSELAWRCKRSEAFYRALAAELRAQMRFDANVLAYALVYKDLDGISEWLGTTQCLHTYVPAPISSSLLKAEPPGLRQQEYWPLVNPRSHPLAGALPVTNADLEQQWRTLLQSWCRKSTLSASDLIQASCYMLSMDRVDDAARLLEEADKTATAALPHACVMQRDYLEAFLILASNAVDLAPAWRLLERHSGVRHAVWAPRWAALRQYLDAITATAAGPPLSRADPDHAVHASAATAGASLTLDSSDIANGRLTCSVGPGQDLSVSLAVYVIDVELLFSCNPFGAAMKDGGEASFVLPTKRTSHALPAGGSGTLDLQDLLHGLEGQSLVLEVTSGEIQRTVSLFSRDMLVQVERQRGVLTATCLRRAADRSQHATPVVAAYVKVFSKSAGNKVEFWKDGYTDRLGRFNYAALSKAPMGGVSQFAVLVASPQTGSCVEIVAAPSWLM